MRGEATQPTAWQVAAIARAFRVQPNDIFEVVGLWEPSINADAPDERQVVELYRGLAGPTRAAAYQHLRVVRELQDAYVAGEPEEPLAAFEPDPEDRAALDESEDFERQ